MKDKSITLADVTEVLYGSKNAVGRGEQFMKKAGKRTALFFDKNGASIVINYDVYKDNYVAARQRGLELNALTLGTSLVFQ